MTPSFFFIRRGQNVSKSKKASAAFFFFKPYLLWSRFFRMSERHGSVWFVVRVLPERRALPPEAHSSPIFPVNRPPISTPDDWPSDFEMLLASAWWLETFTMPCFGLLLSKSFMWFLGCYFLSIRFPRALSDKQFPFLFFLAFFKPVWFFSLDFHCTWSVLRAVNRQVGVDCDLCL